MDEKRIQTLIREGRQFLHCQSLADQDDFVSDQQLKKPQPPLVKVAMSEQRIMLPRNFEDLDIDGDFTEILSRRHSSRVFTQQPISLLQLSYLLWASQGVKEIRGKRYATLRTVPSGGARHGFETYLIVRMCEGLDCGVYHYLPMEHTLEFLHRIDDDFGFTVRTALGEQSECCFLLVAGSLSLRVAIWDSGASSGIDRRGTCWTEFISGLRCAKFRGLRDCGV